MCEKRPAYIIGNKVDLLPRDAPGYLDRIQQSVLTLCEERGITAQHVALISAKTGYGIEKLITRLLRDWKLKGLLFSFHSCQLDVKCLCYKLVVEGAI